MRLNKKAEWWIGLIFGLMTPMFGLAVFLQIYPVLETVTEWRDPAWQMIMMRLATFAVMLNAVVFFLSLRFDKESMARGVLWACAVYLIPLLTMQIINHFQNLA